MADNPEQTADDPRSASQRIAGWVDAHGDYLYRVAMSRVHDRWVAEDVVQETFLAAIRGSGNFEGRSSERTWLVGILKRKVVDHFRTVFRETPSDPHEDGVDIEMLDHQTTGRYIGHWHVVDGPADWGPDPSKALEDKEFWSMLDHCLGNLPPRLAAVFTLYEVEEISTADICRDLGITPTNLWVMLHRARKQLRHCVERNWFAPRSPGDKA